MRKRIGILFAMAILMGIPFGAKAASGDFEAEGKDIKSYGNIIYEDKNGSVKIYAEDIALLQEKLASIPDEIFDPVLYSHMHVWEYKDVTDQGHTKHCDICGSKYDVYNVHSETAAKDYTITFDGRSYPGYEKICECGYTWVEESDHTLVCTPKDETYHTQSCALDGTSYCRGMEAIDLSHLLTVVPTDGTHHQKSCSECGYQGEIEECVFEIEKAEEGTVKKYCACGNHIIESKTAADDPGVTTEFNIMPQIPETSVFSVSENSVSENDIQNEASRGRRE